MPSAGQRNGIFRRSFIARCTEAVRSLTSANVPHSNIEFGPRSSSVIFSGGSKCGPRDQQSSPIG
jgi:hypothetical protein